VIEAKPPGSKPTPPPSKPASAPAHSGANDDESVAAMLLSLGEDGAKIDDQSTAASDADVPAGSTIMDVVPLPPAQDADKKPDDKKQTPAKKPDPKAGDPAHLAAKAILDKYTRRPRANPG
jgi:hypothetical protein